MFTVKTVVERAIHKNRETILERSIREANEVIDLINQKMQLETELDLQIYYKKNKEFLYSNMNKLKRRFYHYRDANNFPRVTVCILYNQAENIACRGLSICSFMDAPVKEDGRDRSEDRAIIAYKEKESSEFIVRMKEYPNVIQNEPPIFVPTTSQILLMKVTNSNPELNSALLSFDFKSEYNASLTQFELKLFKDKPVNETT